MSVRWRNSLILLFICLVLYSVTVIGVVDGDITSDARPEWQDVLSGHSAVEGSEDIASGIAEWDYGHTTPRPPIDPNETPISYQELLDLLQTMQSRFFKVWLGSWPTAIDWTAAVASTIVSATLSTMSSSVPTSQNATHISRDEWDLENLITRYFTQLTSFYQREDILSLRNQAHDDMLWVVLEHLEHLRLISLHTAAHHPTTLWHGAQFGPAFAHRSRIFYDLVASAWDTTLCSGGLVWDPKKEPYKNTITNTLFLAASSSMYLHHPGDPIDGPFVPTTITTPKHDSAHLSAACTAHAWLRAANLTTTSGLYVDGHHISGWRSPKHLGSRRCDVRNEDLYTYNQGVILSGLRDLALATGDASYLAEGHALVRAVMAATVDGPLGRGGVMAERCDEAGACNQDARVFKGVFFHHLAEFCRPFRAEEGARGDGEACGGYVAWVEGNARAALRTRDEDGVVGGWWGGGKHGRGRGRTLETMAAGVAVARCAFEMRRWYG